MIIEELKKHDTMYGLGLKDQAQNVHTTKLKSGMSYSIIENLLDYELHYTILSEMISVNFPWFYNTSMTDYETDYGFFSHTFYKEYRPNSDAFRKLIIPIVQKMNVKGLMEVRANFMTNKNFVYESEWHTDRKFNCKTAIYYVNTNNGYTILDKDEQINIPCKENSMLIFDSDILHKAVSQTDNERRIVINFNYFE